MRATIVILLLAACTKSATGPAFVRPAIPPGKALIYVYRPGKMSGGARTIYLSVPAQANNCYAMTNDGFLVHVTDPGVVTIGASASGDKKLLPVTIAAGEERFVRVEWGTWGGADLAEVAAVEGGPAVQRTRGIYACN
jgi:hypothetical protein